MFEVGDIIYKVYATQKDFAVTQATEHDNFTYYILPKTIKNITIQIKKTYHKYNISKILLSTDIQNNIIK